MAKNNKISIEKREELMRMDMNSWLEDDYSVLRKMIYFSNKDKYIDSHAAKDLIKKIQILDDFSKEDEPLIIRMNMNGGCNTESFAIYDTIKNCRSHVHIEVYGSAYSGAAHILQSADYRTITANSSIMLHDGYIHHPEDDHRNYEYWSKVYERSRNNTYKIYKEIFKSVIKDNTLPKEVILRLKNSNHKIDGKGGFSLKEIESIFDRDLLLDAGESLRMNLVDEII